MAAWINVTWLEPHLGERVLLTDGKTVAEGYRADDGYRRHYGEKWEESLNKYGETFMRVTHWMPLPRPPRG